MRLQQGATDTVAEMLTLGSDLRRVENTASVFALAGAVPDRSIPIGPGDAAAVQRLDWPADAAARLAEQINAGFLAVALKEPVTLGARQRVGWWRVDPGSGETVGVMDSGFHVTLTEDQIKRRGELRAILNPVRRKAYRDTKTFKPNPQSWSNELKSFMKETKSLLDELYKLEHP